MNPKWPQAEKILKNVDQLSADELVDQTYAVTPHPWLISKNVKLPEKYRLAFALLLQILATRPKPGVRPPKAKPLAEKKEAALARLPEEEIVRTGRGAPPPKEVAIPNYYEVLGVSENASYEEIRDAYRDLAKEYHPDVLRSQGLSDEEMAAATARMQDYNDAWLVLSKDASRKVYDDVRKSPPLPSLPSPTGEPLQEKPPGKVVITFKPTAEKKPETDKALAKTSEFRQLVTDAGAVSLDDEIAQLKEEGVLPEEFKGPELTTALLALREGGKADNLFAQAREAGFLTDEERKSLFVAADIMENIEAAEPQLTQNLQAAYQYPQIIIERAPPEVTTPQKNQILLTVKDNILSPVTKRGTKLAKGKAKKFASKAAKKGAKKLGKKAGRKVATEGAKLVGKLAARELISDAISAIGLATGPFAVIVVPLLKALAWVATWLAEKAISRVVDFIRRHKEDLTILLLGLGVLMGSPLLLGVGVLGAGLFGPAAVFARAGVLVGAFFAAFAALLIPSVAIPLIVSLLVTVLVVGLITFIINSGAYVVPFAPSILTPGSIESPFIGVEKVASPKKVDNPPPSRTIDYTITITAKLGSLTNITFLYECRVIGEGAGTPCPSPSPSIPDPPGIISAVEPFVITYSVTYDSKYRNSVVVDTFTVTADAPGQPGATAATSASVVIGDPPIDCPLPGGVITWGSYVPGDETSKLHGNNRYWAQTGVPSCSWGLPQGICYGPSQSAASSNVCYNNSKGACSFYGYAIDVMGGKDVFAPQVGGVSVTWSCSFAFANGGGTAGYTYICTSGPYTLVLTHLNNNATTGTVSSGERIGELYPNPNHLHLEFRVSGAWQRPEDFFCL